MTRSDIKAQTREALVACLAEWGEPAYRVDQILGWLYPCRARAWSEMTNMPKALRQRLEERFTHRTLELARKQGAVDATQKFLWRLADGSLVESVLIPANPALYGDASDRPSSVTSTSVSSAFSAVSPSSSSSASSP